MKQIQQWPQPRFSGRATQQMINHLQSGRKQERLPILQDSRKLTRYTPDGKKITI